jgi:hypothetical protein
MTSEEIMLRHAVRLSLQAALKEAAEPKPIIMPVKADVPEQWPHMASRTVH